VTLHDTTGPAADYEWPTCTACTTPLRENELGRQLCHRCEARTLDRITELGGLATRINTTTAILRGAARPGAGTSDPSVAAVPLLVGTLSLAATGGLATRLGAIEDAWRAALGRPVLIRQDQVRIFAAWRTHPATAIPEHLTFLRWNLDWAAREYDSIADDVEEIRALHRECSSALDPGPRPRPVKIGLCPASLADGARCRTRLTARPPASVIRCSACGMVWDGKDAWERLQHAQATMPDPGTTAAAADLATAAATPVCCEG
jgi:hypothetical protein